MIPQQFADSLIAPNKQVGFNKDDFGQCTSIPQLWWAAHKLPFLVGNAVDLPKAADPKYFEVYNYVPGFQAKPGDVIIWAECIPLGIGVYGHTDLYINDLGGGKFRGADQNWPVGSPPRYITHTWQGVVKIIRIKEEYLMGPLFDNGDRYNFNVRLYGSDLGFHSEFVGKPYKDAAEGIFNSPECKERLYFNSGDAANVDTWLRTTDASTQLNKLHKLVLYDYVRTHIPNGTPVTQLQPGHYEVK